MNKEKSFKSRKDTIKENRVKDDEDRHKKY